MKIVGQKQGLARFGVLLVGFGFWAQGLIAEPPCFSKIRSLAVVEDPRHDVTAEIEPRMSPLLMSLLTTTDGTIRPLFKFRSSIRGIRGRAKCARWDSLDYAEQKRLIELAIQNGVGGLRIPGLVFRDKIELQLKAPIQFRGETIPAGPYTFHASEFFRDGVELMSPIARNIKRVEIHFRDRGAAGRVSRDSKTILRAIGFGDLDEIDTQHLHILGQVGNEPAKGFTMTEVFRRANLAAEMISIVEGRETLSIARVESMFAFGPLRRKFMPMVFLQLDRDGKSLRLKEAFVGVRGIGFYDEPNTWGLENRMIDENIPPEIHEEFSNALQVLMHSDLREISDEISNWIVDVQMRLYEKKDGPNRLLSEEEARQIIAMSSLSFINLQYNGDWNDLYKDCPRNLKSLLSLSDIENLKAQTDISNTQSRHTELKMLIYNWSEDPLLSKHPQLKRRVRAAQIAAIKKLKGQTAKSVNEIMRPFLLESGLYERVLNSLGLEIEFSPADELIAHPH